MKTSLILPLCLLSGPLLAAGIYEIDRGQWEQKPAASSTQPPTPRTSQTSKSTAPPAANSTSPTPATPSSAPGQGKGTQGEVVHNCQDQGCGELQ